MTDELQLLDTMHEATHRIPGVPAHVDRPAGHQGRANPGRTAHASSAKRRSVGRSWNHSPARRPRVLAAWQQRIAAIFGQKL